MLKRRAPSQLTKSPSLASKRAKTDTLTRNATTVRRAVRPVAELKRIDAYPNGSTGTAYYRIEAFPHPVEGDGPNNRNGARISCRRLSVRGSLYKTNAVSMQTWRVLVFVWKQNLTSPTANSILLNPTSTMYHSDYNIRTQPYFTVLYDKTFTINAQTLALSGSAFADAKVDFEYHRNVNIPMTFSSGGSAIPPSDNQVYCMLVTDTATAPNFEMNLSNNYIDV